MAVGSRPRRDQASHQGQGLIEYAIILSLIALVVIGLLTQLGKATSTALCGVSQALNGQSYSSLSGWGRNDNSQLGNASAATPNDPSPKSVQNLNTCVWAVVSGAGTTAAVSADGTVWTWGNDTQLQLGNGSASAVNSAVPAQVVDSNGNRLTNITSVAAGIHHFLALKTDGTVWAWGENSLGQIGPLGAGGGGNNPGAVQVTGMVGTIIAVGASDFSSYAIRSDGNIYSWGSNSSNQLGGSCGACASTGTPGLITDGGQVAHGIVQISSRAANVMGLARDGSLWVWGRNQDGQLASGSPCSPDPCGTSTPAPVGLTNVVSIATSEYSDYALRSDGTMWSWGRNQTGELGIGNNTGPSLCVAGTIACGLTPAQVVGTSGSGTLTAISAIGANSAGGYAVINSSLYGWGQNQSGEIGTGSTTSNSCNCIPTPTASTAVTGKVFKVIGGFNMAFAILAR